jgi:hypothetical protein
MGLVGYRNQAGNTPISATLAPMPKRPSPQSRSASAQIRAGGQRAHSVANIAHQQLHGVLTPGRPSLLTDQRPVAEGTQCLRARILSIHARGQILIDLPSEMLAQLIRQARCPIATIEQHPDPYPQLLKPSHGNLFIFRQQSNRSPPKAGSSSPSPLQAACGPRAAKA